MSLRQNKLMHKLFNAWVNMFRAPVSFVLTVYNFTFTILVLVHRYYRALQYQYETILA